jgi:hypothetical protein
MLIFLYTFGSYVFVILGNYQRGGVSWGISVSILYGWFFVLSFTQHMIINRSHERALAVSTITFVLYAVGSFAFAGNNFTNSGWVHPYRFLYLEMCALVLIIIPAVKQLTHHSRGTR